MNLKKLKRTIEKEIPAETLARFDFPRDATPESAVAIINQMDALLSEEQRLAIMQEQGCCKTGKGDKAHRAFGRAHAGKATGEKARLLNDETNMPHRAPCRLNPDGTLSVWWGFGRDGGFGCVCGIVKELPETTRVPATFCGCCGGHIRHNYQNSLGVKLRLKKIVSSAASSGGKKHCEFLYEIVG
ncbi:MAG: hypothetical protein FWF96_00500 [Kiritimatiellaeota bacterium]|nr:hypothetical protein [Kiritimatiellota bacterium]